jgi:hypothetical protein
MAIMILNPKTPICITATVKQLAAALGLPSTKLHYLRYTHKSDEYKPLHCFNNCENEQIKYGGEVAYGWLIWEDRKRSFIEAEFHSVRKINGELVDISPRQSKKNELVLFIEDKTRISGRKNSTTWHSWSNLKMLNGLILEQSRHLEVSEISTMNKSHANDGNIHNNHISNAHMNIRHRVRLVELV